MSFGETETTISYQAWKTMSVDQLIEIRDQINFHRAELMSRNIYWPAMMRINKMIQKKSGIIIPAI